MKNQGHLKKIIHCQTPLQRFKPKYTLHRQCTAVYVSVPKKIVKVLILGCVVFIFIVNIFYVFAHLVTEIFVEWIWWLFHCLNECVIQASLYNVPRAQFSLWQNENFGYMLPTILWFHICCVKCNDQDTLGRLHIYTIYNSDGTWTYITCKLIIIEQKYT